MNYIFLTSKVHNELKDRYINYRKVSDKITEFNNYINELFNPSNRGIIYNKISDEPLKIKIWANKFSLVLEEFPERKGLKAIAFKEIDVEKFNLMLKFCEVLTGEWDFALLSSNVESNADLEELKEQISYNMYKEEFNEFSEYWKSYDIITQKRECKIKQEKEKSITKFSKLAINFDNSTVLFKLEDNSYKFKEGQSIKMSSSSNSEINKSVGQVLSYDKSLKQLVVECLVSDTLQEIAENKENKRGYISIDDIGTMSMLKRQKIALKRLFNRETANRRLKDFIPNISAAESQIEDSIDEDEFSDYYRKMNKSQKEAVKRALECEDIYLIQGPPGTGKTTVICEIIKYLSKNGYEVLVSSQNHLAVDNVLQRVGDDEFIRAIRIGKEDKIELGCEKFSLINRVKDIQKTIRRKILNYEAKFSEINIKLKNKEKMYNYYIKAQDDVKLIVNLLNSYYNHNTIKSDLQKRKLQYESKIFSIKNELNEIQSRLNSNIEDLKLLINIINNNNYSLEDIQIVIKVSDKWNLTENDLRVVETYKNIVLELEDVIINAKNVESKIKENVMELNQLRVDFKDVKTRILSLATQFDISPKGVQLAIVDKIDEEKEELRILKEEYRNKNYKIKALVSKKQALIKKITLWKEQADRYKHIIEEIISITTDEGMSKKEFIEAVDLRERLLKDLGGDLGLLKLIPYISQNKKIDKFKYELDSVELDLESIQNSIFKEESILSAIIDKLEYYNSKDEVDIILKYNNLSIYDLNQEFIFSINAFIKEYDSLKNKLKLYMSTKDLRNSWFNQLETYQSSFEDMYIGVSNVVCSTCSGISSASNNYFLEKEFDYVIIDEAAKCFSSELLIPMVKGRRIILVGDHKQISPLIEKEILDEMEQENNLVNEELKKYLKSSLFGIMFKGASDNLKTILNTQYRMNADISRFVSSRFYNSQLKDGSNVINKIHGVDELSHGIYWVGTTSDDESKEIQYGSSYYNQEEINLTITLLKWLDNKLKTKKEIGIISPYKVQKNKLEEQLIEYKFSNIDIEINTIDAFQGREKQIIIMNCVRNNLDGKFGHTSGDARMNVAISRAQELLFIIGNEKFIENNKKSAKSIYNLLEYLKKSSSVLNFNFFKC